MNNYKVSVIIPSYNTEKYVEETFESIKNQTFNFEDLEIIFIDDKSTDGSVDILKGYEDEYDNVFVYTSPEGKKGPGISRNFGITKATADYVIFLDADDVMFPEYVERVYAEITENGVDLVKSSYCVDVGEFTFPVTQDLGRVEVSPDDFTVLMDFNYLEPWATIYRREYLIEENIRFIEKFNIHESFLFAVETIAKAKNGIIILDDFQCQIWRIRDDGLHNRTLTEQDLEYTMHCISEMLLMVANENQPLSCIRKLTDFILSLWSFDLVTSKEPMEIINGFTFATGFKIDPESISDAFS
ncbi:glycosyltransferase family 2 protein [uncultured Methanobrevibacter sp.]|uniref:glycosyltransferase family 2 protein n=1 Tax=uncultured Methanobrevibacter sp. TaxID=253161 RepID=UPI0025DA0325|nr:glycosyltransferase family 2 protein [uncultured Methanobrevibacter sp.]